MFLNLILLTIFSSAVKVQNGFHFRPPILPLSPMAPIMFPPVFTRSPRRRGAAGIKGLGKFIWGAMTFRKATFSIMAFSIMTLRNDTHILMTLSTMTLT
jgi:hypothetical protein